MVKIKIILLESDEELPENTKYTYYPIVYQLIEVTDGHNLIYDETTLGTRRKRINDRLAKI